MFPRIAHEVGEVDRGTKIGRIDGLGFLVAGAGFGEEAEAG